MNSNPKKSGLIRRSGTSNFSGIAALLLLILFHPWLGLTIPFVWIVLVALTAALLFYASMTVIIASQDLERYGSIIMHEALLRFAAAGLLIFASFFFGWWGILVFLIGLSDLFWGVAYCVIVPQATGRSIKQLLFLEERADPRAANQQDALSPEDGSYAYKI